MNHLLSYIILFIGSVLLIGCYRYYALRRGQVVLPNHRTSHLVPTPQGAGIGIVSLWLVYLLIATVKGYVPYDVMLTLLPGTVLLAAIGLIDDKFHVAARWRFITQIVASLLAIFFIGPISTLHLGLFHLSITQLCVPFVLLAMLWSINLFNFMDGLDGLAGVEACTVFLVGGYFLWHSHASYLALQVWAIVPLTLGFLVWNWHPAKIFMGDVGSCCLGYLVVAFAVLGQTQFGIPAILWFILYGAFIFDATASLIRRVIKGYPLYIPHRSQAYQRLHQSGLTHAQVAKSLLSVNIVLSGIALYGYFHPQSLLMLSLSAGLFLFILYLYIEYRKPMFSDQQLMVDPV